MTIEIELAGKLRAEFDLIEEAYEFMLAYSAQGRRREITEGGGGESQIRQYLRRFAGALEGVQSALSNGIGTEVSADFETQFSRDVATALSVVNTLLSKPSITSDMVDNANGLIAMRSFLTGLFFVDQAILTKR